MCCIQEKRTESKDFEINFPLESPPSIANKTYPDVIIENNPSNPQKNEVRRLPQDLKDILSNIPSRTDLAQYDINLTTTDPIQTSRNKFRLLLAVQDETKKMI